MKYNSNPVRFEDGQWWFYDEIWMDRCGPFETKKEATDACAEYCRGLFENE